MPTAEILAAKFAIPLKGGFTENHAADECRRRQDYRHRLRTATAGCYGSWRLQLLFPPGEIGINLTYLPARHFRPGRRFSYLKVASKDGGPRLHVEQLRSLEAIDYALGSRDGAWREQRAFLSGFPRRGLVSAQQPPQRGTQVFSKDDADRPAGSPVGLSRVSQLRLGANLHWLRVRRPPHQRADGRVARAVRGTAADRRNRISRTPRIPSRIFAGRCSSSRRMRGIFSTWTNPDRPIPRARFHPAASDRKPKAKNGRIGRTPRHPERIGGCVADVFYPAVGRCIYCGATEPPLGARRFTDEHIIPLALGGNLILQEASCTDCAAIINREIETPVLSLNGGLPTNQAKFPQAGAKARGGRPGREHVTLTRRWSPHADPGRGLFLPGSAL